MATSKNFIESYATSQETSQAEAKRVMDAVEDAFKSHLATMKPGDKFTFCGLIVDVFEVPARVGQSYLTGTTMRIMASRSAYQIQLKTAFLIN